MDKITQVVELSKCWYMLLAGRLISTQNVGCHVQSFWFSRLTMADNYSLTGPTDTGCCLVPGAIAENSPAQWITSGRELKLGAKAIPPCLFSVWP